MECQPPRAGRMGCGGALPIGSMGLVYLGFTYIYYKNQLDVGKYTIHRLG